MSFILKSISPFWAVTANKCKIVLVEPPITMSKIIAFSKALKLAIEPGIKE
jgi:hypothetical protein